MTYHDSHWVNMLFATSAGYKIWCRIAFFWAWDASTMLTYPMTWPKVDEVVELTWQSVAIHRDCPLVMTNRANWKNTMLLMGKSTISMAIFHRYVKLPEGRSIDHAKKSPSSC